MLKRKHRLAKFKDVKRTFAQGRSFFNPFYRIKFFKKEEGLRLTVVVSSRVSKKAVERNALKRRVREFLRKNIKSLEKGDYVIDTKPKITQLPNKEQQEHLLGLLRSSKLI